MIEIKLKSITELKTDVIVNAANEHLIIGSGVCGAVFKAAGVNELTKACDEVGHCDTGSAVITPGFNLAKYIIHTVGPRYKDGNSNEEKLLYSCYQNVLDLAKQYECKSIGFPLISSGIYRYPVEDAWKVAIRSIYDWFKENDYEIDVVFAVLDESIKRIGVETINNIKR